MVKKTAITAKGAPAPRAPYSQGLRVGNLLYVSGQIPLDPATGTMVSGDIRAATKQVMANVGSILEAGGATFDDVVKVNVYLTDMKDFAAVNEVYLTFLGPVKPARAAVQVSALPLGASIEIEAVAYLD